jgi:4-oxalocrotonate tautomerase
MPVVKIDMWEGRSASEKGKLIGSVSRAVSEALGIPVEHVTVVINDVPKENWGMRGEQASASGQA